MSESRLVTGDDLGPMAANLAAGESLGGEAGRAAKLIRETRATATKLTEQANLVEAVYQNGFLQDVEIANQLVTSIASGDMDSVAFDAQSLGEHGDDPATVKEYLSGFIAQDPSRPSPFAKLTFPTTAVIEYQGKEHHIANSSVWFPLSPYNFSPNFNPSVTLPALVDPQIRTFAELAELEAIDPGHAEQLIETYRMAAREQKTKDPRATFLDPRIVRMVAIVPTGYDYLTDFVPQVEMQRREQAWDPYLLVNGALNPSGNYLSTDLGKRDRVVFNRDGKEAALRVSRPLPGQVAEDQAQALMPLTDHEMNKMAVILFPYERQHKTKPEYVGPYVGHSGMFGMGTRGPTKSGGDIGGATISAGASGWASADKRSEGILGDLIVPKTAGQPMIYSVRLLTAQRDPDAVR